MQRKLASYVLLSFLSFTVFTAFFHTVANAQTSELIAAPSIFPAASPAPVITPTVQPTQIPSLPSTVKFKLQSAAIPSATPTPQQTQQPMPTPTIYQVPPTKMPTPTTVPTIAVIAPTAIPTPTEVPQPKPTVAVASDLDTLFSKYAEEYKVDKEDLKRIAKCEAGFNAQADTGTYAGMFQFASSTWISNRSAMGLDTNPDLRKNAEESIRTAAFMINRGGRGSWPNC